MPIANAPRERNARTSPPSLAPRHNTALLVTAGARRCWPARRRHTLRLLAFQPHGRWPPHRRACHPRYRIKNGRGYQSCPFPRKHSRAHERGLRERKGERPGRTCSRRPHRTCTRCSHPSRWQLCGRSVGLHVVGWHTQPVEDMAVVANALRVERVVVRVAQL
eukprot:2120937-Prymnesium_polylepis.3